MVLYGSKWLYWKFGIEKLHSPLAKLEGDRTFEYYKFTGGRN